MAAKEDRVVQEIPVFLSKELQGKLYLLQHILRPSHSNFENANVLEAKIKAKQEKLQLTLEVDPYSTRYDRDIGERMAPQSGKDRDEPSSSSQEERPVMDEEVLESFPIPEHARSTRYVVGAIRNGELHLTTLKSILQMKPVFPHLNRASDKKKRSANNANQESGGESGSESEEEATKITVKFTQSRNPGAKERLSRNFNALKKRLDEEPWLDLTYILYNELELNKLFCPKTNQNSPPVFMLPREDYLKLLLPKHVGIDANAPHADTKTKAALVVPKRQNISQLKDLGLSEQVRTLVLYAGVLRYSQLVEYLRQTLGASLDDNSVLHTLQTIAVLVQGYWVVRSDLVYGAEYSSGAHGISGVLMQKARDAILNQFARFPDHPSDYRNGPSGSATFSEKDTPSITRKDICDLTHLPNEEVTEILSKIAVWKPCLNSTLTGGWVFSHPFDTEFVAKHPDIVQRQKLIFEMKNRNRNSQSNSVDVETDGILASPPRRRRSRGVSFSSDVEAESEAAKNGRQATNNSTGLSYRDGRPSN